MDRRDKLREDIAKNLKVVNKHVVELSDVRDLLMSEKQFDQFYEGYIDYLGGDRRRLPEDSSEIDDELWDNMMKAWLETKSDLSKLAPLIPKTAGGLPSKNKLKGADDTSDDEIGEARTQAAGDANDAEEEE